MTRLLFIIGIFFTTIGFGQTPKNNSLLVAEYKKSEEGIGNYTHLVSYNFTNGKLISKDTILSAPTSKGQYQGTYVGYDFGNNFVYQSRYVISGMGNVIDTQTKSLVIEESDDLVETRGDSIIFHRDNIITGTGYLVCDLNDRSYKFVKNKKFLSVKGINSPNHLWGLEVDRSEFQNKIILYNKKNRQKVIVNNCGTGTLLSSYASTMPYVPIYWSDNQHFLYATYNPSGRTRTDSVTASVMIYKINIGTKSSEVVAEIDSVPPAISRARFSPDPKGRIIFYSAKGQFEIDLDKKQAIPYKMSSVGNEFSIENNSSDDYGRIISFQNKEIGRVWCSYYNAKTTTDFIGVEYGDVGSNLGHPKGVSVWNKTNETWVDIEIPWLSSIIGWIERE